MTPANADMIDPTRRVGIAFVLPLIAFGLVMGPSLAAPSATGPSRPDIPRVQAAPSGQYFDHLVLIVLEGLNICDVLTYCGGYAPYLTALSDAYAIADQDHYCKEVHPGLPNYLCLTGGTDFGCADYNEGPNSNACTATAWNATNIADRLEGAGLSWKAYLEDMPSACSSTSSGLYEVRRNPFVYYRDIATNATRCSARVVPSGNAASALLGDLASPSTAPNYAWFSPNSCNGMVTMTCHISVGDQYLSILIPKILNSTVFQAGRAALVVTFAEAYGGSPIYHVWAGPLVKRGYASSYAYTHYSLLATIEANWNLTALTSNDRDADHMGEFFLGQPSRGFTVPPPHPISRQLLVAISGSSGIGVIVVSMFLLSRERRRSRPESETPPDPPG
jgi:phosphatidylinositol-3-phosphatase